MTGGVETLRQSAIRRTPIGEAAGKAAMTTPGAFCIGMALLSLILVFITAPTWRMQFHSDDLCLLIEDQSLPLTQSHDQLHRPFRNAIDKLAERQLGLTPAPYRITVLLLYLGTCALLAILLWQLHIREPLAVAFGVFVFAVYPRNHPVLFWFAASQDVVVAFFSVLSCVAFLKYRQGRQASFLAASILSFIVGLGFKETAIITIGLILIADFLWKPELNRLYKRDYWVPYLILSAVIVIYAGYFLADSGADAIAGKRTGGYYGAGGAVTIGAALIRKLANMLMPFSSGFALRDMTAFQLIVCMGGLLSIGLLAFRLQRGVVFVAGLAWALIALLPVAVFAHAVNADHYLFVASISLALVGADLAAVVLARGSALGKGVVLTALTIYSLTGTYQLVGYRDMWQAGSREYAHTIRSILSVLPSARPDSTLYVAGVTHSIAAAPVANNGLAGGLWGNGYDRSTTIVRNFDEASSLDERLLLNSLLACPAEELPGPSLKRVVVLDSERHSALDRTGPCALALIQADLVKRPEAWLR